MSSHVKIKEQYEQEVVPHLTKQFGYKNHMQVPRLEKVVINMGLGEAASNAKAIDSGVKDLVTVTGQKPVVNRARKSIATFKVRKGMPVGASVTLRGRRMYDFLAKLIHIALPRIRDFRGLSNKSFDGRGNYSLGVKEQLIFPRSITSPSMQYVEWTLPSSRPLAPIKKRMRSCKHWECRSKSR